MRHFRFFTLLLMGMIVGGGTWIGLANDFGLGGAIAGLWAGSIAAGLAAWIIHAVWLATERKAKARRDAQDIPLPAGTGSLYPDYLRNVMTFVLDVDGRPSIAARLTRPDPSWRQPEPANDHEPPGARPRAGST